MASSSDAIDNVKKFIQDKGFVVTEWEYDESDNTITLKVEDGVTIDNESIQPPVRASVLRLMRIANAIDAD